MVAQHRAVEEFRVSAVGAIPGVATVRPGQAQSEGGKEVVERPGDDGIVVEANVEGHEDHSITNSCVGTQRFGFPKPSPGAAAPGELALSTALPNT